jgi:hypothetical protein
MKTDIELLVDIEVAYAYPLLPVVCNTCSLKLSARVKVVSSLQY